MFHKRLLREFKENKKYVAGMVLTQWICLLCSVALMFAAALFLQKLVLTPDKMTGKESVALLLMAVGACLLRAAANTLSSRYSFAASTCVKEKLRLRLYQKLTRLGGSYRDTSATSEVVQVATEGVDQLEIYFGKYIPQFFYSLLAPVTLFFIVGTMSLRAAAALLFCVPLIPLSIVAVQKFAKKLLGKYWGSYTRLGDTFLEGLMGLTTLKIYQADEDYAKRMDEEAEQFRKATMRVLIMQLNSISVMDLVAYGGAAAGILIALAELRAGSVTMAECFFIIMISAEFFLPLRLLGSFFHIAMNGSAAADKIFRLLDASEPGKGRTEGLDNEDICFNEVIFSYPEQSADKAAKKDAKEAVLKGVSFELPAQSFTALAGSSGSGKSTIVSLIMQKARFSTEEVHGGSIVIGGVPVEELSREAVCRKITRVGHDSYLFAGTVHSNLKLGNPNASMEAMEEALRRVDLYDTAMQKGGLEMEISEGARNLSGGQKQRLALARALLKDSDIYIFDEATSNVDAESEAKIMKVICSLAREKTVLLISHRLANMDGADRILVLKDGKIEEQGSKEALMRENGYFAKLYRAQAKLEQYAKEAV